MRDMSILVQAVVRGQKSHRAAIIVNLIFQTEDFNEYLFKISPRTWGLSREIIKYFILSKIIPIVSLSQSWSLVSLSAWQRFYRPCAFLYPISLNHFLLSFDILFPFLGLSILLWKCGTPRTIHQGCDPTDIVLKQMIRPASTTRKTGAV